MTVYHHRSSDFVSKHILSKWRKGEWLNNFVTQDVTLSHSPSVFPSPDCDFQDNNIRTRISFEFKPYTETKRGMMTGVGQSIAYLKKANASYLISPSVIDDLQMENYLNDLFQKFIKGKLPVGLIIYDGVDLSNIRLKCDIDSTLSPSTPVELTNTSYWCFWRDLPPDGFYKLSKSAEFVTDKTERSEKVWDYFFYNFYTPLNTRNTLDLIESEIFMWDYQNKMIPFSTTKRKLTSDVNAGSLSLDEALNLLKKKWSKNETDNLYRDYKKNYINFMNHNNLWDENFYLTPLGKKFVMRYEQNYDNKLQLIDEITQIILVEGKYDNLITDIKTATQSFTILNDDNTYLKELYKYFDSNGFIAKNPNRTTSGIREFFQSEKQLLRKLDLIEMNRDRFFNLNKGYLFKNERKEKLIEEFYKNYGDVSSIYDNESISLNLN